jgi:hypothetical protein
VPTGLTRLPHRSVMALVGAVTVVLIAGCGGSDENAPSPGETDPAQDGNPLAAYTDCMRRNGVTLAMPSGGVRMRPSGAPDGGPGGVPPSGMPRPSAGAGGPAGGLPGGGGFSKPEGVDDATWEKAQGACASLRPSFGGRPDRNGPDGADAAYRTCLRDNGVTPGSTLSTTDPAVAEAMETCDVLRPTAGATPTA